MVSRRGSLKTFSVALVAAGFAKAAAASSSAPLVPAGAKTLDELTTRIALLTPRRDFKTVPMILDNRDQWDADALDAVLHYSGGPKQSWDNTDITGPWLNVMRNAMNAEIWSFKHPDFLCVSATHGSAQLALYDDAIWEKYGLAKLAGPGITKNTFLKGHASSDHDPKDYQNADGAFSPRANSIQGLQRRGAFFLACHNAVWELCEKLIATGSNPDHLSAEAMCAELSNHLAPGAILTPGAVGTLVELASNGFAYAR